MVSKNTHMFYFNQSELNNIVTCKSSVTVLKLFLKELRKYLQSLKIFKSGKSPQSIQTEGVRTPKHLVFTLIEVDSPSLYACTSGSSCPVHCPVSTHSLPCDWRGCICSLMCLYLPRLPSKIIQNVPTMTRRKILTYS